MEGSQIRNISRRHGILCVMALWQESGFFNVIIAQETARAAEMETKTAANFLVSRGHADKRPWTGRVNGPEDKG